MEDKQTCFNCVHSKDFAPNIGSITCMDLCRRGSEFDPIHYGDPEAKRLVDRGKELDAMVADIADDSKSDDDGIMRSFNTGATRDTGEGKLDFAGFLSSQALRQFARYMNMNRLQSDGQLRDSDNWKRGIPMPVYVSSGFRHFWEVWETFQCENWNGDREQTIRLVTAICGEIFNMQGLLHEILKVVDEVRFDDDEPTSEMKERQDAIKKVSETEEA